MTPDQFNGLFEGVGGLMIWVSIRRTLVDRAVQGVSAWSLAFFTSWGYWNLYFYGHLGQSWSLAGAVFMVLSNTVWIALVIRRRISDYLTQRAMRQLVEGIKEHGMPQLKPNWQELYAEDHKNL